MEQRVGKNCEVNVLRERAEVACLRWENRSWACRIYWLRYERMKESEVLFLMIVSQGHNNIVRVTDTVCHSS